MFVNTRELPQSPLLFPLSLRYFREMNGMSNIGEGGRLTDQEDLILRELVLALERARSRLAVVMASEGKAALLWHWKRYVETDLRMRRSLQLLRKTPLADPQRFASWANALENLKRLPVSQAYSHQGLTVRFCTQLADVLETLEKPAHEKK